MILGIDPGLSGAFVLLSASSGPLYKLIAPVLTLKRNGASKRVLDTHTIACWLKHNRQYIDHAAVELVGSMPGQGVSSTFSFGKSAGIIEGLLVALDIPFTMIAPAVWKKATKTPADKDGARARASQLMPALSEHWRPLRGVMNTDQASGVAEAALIAYHFCHVSVLENNT